MGTDADDTVFIQVLCGVFAHVRNVGSQLLHSALGVTHLGNVFVYMHGSEDIPADHPFGKHDGVLVVVSFPRHECHFQVASEGQFAILCGVAFRHYLSLLHDVALPYDRLEQDCGALVGPSVYRKLVDCDLRGEAYEFLVIGTVVFHMDFIGIHIYHLAFSFGSHLCP